MQIYILFFNPSFHVVAPTANWGNILGHKAPRSYIQELQCFLSSTSV